MANIKSSKKDILRTKRNHDRNVALKSKMKTVVKKAAAAIETDAETKAELTQAALKTIDKTAAKGVIHKNTAARKKSRLAKKLNTTGAAQAPAEAKPAKAAAKPKTTAKPAAKTATKKPTAKAASTRKKTA